MLERDNYWARVFRRQMSRRAALRAGAAAALGAAGFALGGCESGSSDKPAASASPNGSGQPRYGGTVIYGRGTDPVGLDPHSDIASLDIFVKFYSNLYFLSAGRQAVMNLAESMEVPDQQTFNFTLRRGAKFHDIAPVSGREVTSEDVKLSFQRRGGAPEVIDKRFPQLIEQMNTPDDYTFQVVLRQPFVPAFTEMGNPTWAIVPKELVGTNLKQQGIGSGPFILQRFVRAESVEMVRNPSFFIPGRPYLDRVKYVVIPSQDTLMAAFKSGQHDVNGANLDARNTKDLEANPNITVNRVPNFFYPVVAFQMRKPPFDNVLVREAVDLAIDRQELIDKIAFGEGQYNGPLSWGHVPWALPQEELRAFYRCDPQKARALLAEAGYPDGLNVSLKTANISGFWADTVTLIAQQFARAGINVDLQLMELGLWLGTVVIPGKFEMLFAVQIPYEEPDRPIAYYHSRGVTGSGNVIWAGDKEIDALIEKQQVTFDEAERQTIFHDLQRLIMQVHGPVLPLFGNYSYTAFWNYMKGWLVDDKGTYSYIFNWDLWKDKA